MKDLFKNRGFLILLGATALIIVILAVVFFTGSDQSSDVPSETEEPSFEVAMPEYEYNNPKDYSEIEPGTEFYDEFWNGTVTIVGSVDELSLDQVYAGADGRLVTVQDGMYIYVDREDNTDEEDRTYVDDTAEEDIPAEEVEADNNDEDASFYESSPAVTLNYEAGSAVNSGKIAPSDILSGVRYAIGRFLDDMGIEGVSSVTILADYINYAENPRSYTCSFDNDPENGVVVSFNWNTCEWQLSLTADPKKVASYNPLAFIAPSRREDVCDTLNQVMGYDAFSVDDVTLPDIKIVAPEPETEPETDEGNSSVEDVVATDVQGDGGE